VVVAVAPFLFAGCAVFPAREAATVLLRARNFPAHLGSTGVAIVSIDGTPVPHILHDQEFSLLPGRHEVTVRHYTRFGAFKFVPCEFKIRRTDRCVLQLRYHKGKVEAVAAEWLTGNG